MAAVLSFSPVGAEWLKSMFICLLSFQGLRSVCDAAIRAGTP